MSDCKPAVIIDNGSYIMKAGLSDQKENVPKCVFPSIVGYSKTNETDIFVGNKAFEKQNELRIVDVFDNATVADYEALEKLWKYTYEQLKTDPKEHN
ncbi:putative actin, partial [Entamoeba invadens IP1]